MFIKNYGLFWKRNNVDWGNPGPGNAGALLGKLPDEQNSPEINFRDQFGVYALYNRNKALLYCGLAGIGRGEGEAEIQKLFKRIKQHQQDENNLSEYWTYFSWFGLQGVEGDVLNIEEDINGTRVQFLLQIKAIMIQLANPPANKNPANFNPAVEYEQVRDPRLDE